MKHLEEKYGSVITPQELGGFLRLDHRTVIKYASHWGGVEVLPGKWRFFENLIKEKLDAKFDNKARQEAVSCECDVSRSPRRQIVSGRDKKILERSLGVGRAKKSRTPADGRTDKFRLFDSS